MRRKSGNRTYTEQCAECNTTIEHIATKKADAHKYFRGLHWGTSGGQWYCPLHKPSKGNSAAADTFRRMWETFCPDLVQPWHEYRFHPTRGWTFDFAFLDGQLGVEIDGGGFLVRTGEKGTMVGGRHNSDSDREKLNAAATLGWRIIRFSRQQVEKDPLNAINVVREALGLPKLNLDGGQYESD